MGRSASVFLWRGGVEGSGSLGAGLLRVLTGAGLIMVEVGRPDRAVRCSLVQAALMDSYAARAATSGRATGTSQSGGGLEESTLCLRLAQRSAVKVLTWRVNSSAMSLNTGRYQCRPRRAGRYGRRRAGGPSAGITN